MAAHEGPRTTKLYDRTGNETALEQVERIRIRGGDDYVVHFHAESQS
jgi:hypothetical protein